MTQQILPETVGAAVPPIGFGLTSTSQLKFDYQSTQQLLSLQPGKIRRFLKIQSSQLAEAYLNRQSRIRFELPDQVFIETETLQVGAGDRQHSIGGLVERVGGKDMRYLLRCYLTELELSPDPAMSAAARLVRFVTADFLIDERLPSGREVSYTTPDRDDIPSIPNTEGNQTPSALTSEMDALVIDEDVSSSYGELQVPFTPFARRFYLPQWIAFDETGHLLVGSIQEAEAILASMQNYLEILHAAVALTPYMVANPLYQRKRSGMLGQLVNQGRIYASYETNQIIVRIQSRAAAQELNRGLSLSLPYFNDQDLQIQLYPFEIIPAGRVMFVAAFVARAARLEQAKVAQDTRLSPSTRKYLLAELERLEKAFESTNAKRSQ